MRYVYTSNIRDGKHEECTEWLRCGELEKVHPEGWKFLGAYNPVFGLGEGQIELHWEVESFAAFDAARAAAKKGDRWFETLNQLHSNLEASSGRGRFLASIGEGVLVGC